MPNWTEISATALQGACDAYNAAKAAGLPEAEAIAAYAAAVKAATSRAY